MPNILMGREASFVKRIIALLLAFLLMMSVCPVMAEAADDPLTVRRLSDEEIAALDRCTPGEVRAAIATLADARAYLNRRYPSLWHDAGTCFYPEDPCLLYHAASYFMHDAEAIIGRCDIATLTTWLLNDDMDICGVYAVGDGVVTRAVNRVALNGEYAYIDMVRGMDADEMSQLASEPPLPEARCESHADYIALLLADETLHSQITAIATESNGWGLSTYTENGFRTFAALNCDYSDDARRMTAEEYDAWRYGHIQPENIGQYEISQVLGGATLTPDEARALVGAEPEAVQAAVSTAADVLMYMLAARIMDSHGDRVAEVDGQYWHYNMSAQEVMASRTGNCGSCANLARYLLDGDYDEVGIMLQAYEPGNGGGHVYNYILQDGKYTIIDYSWYIFGDYRVENDFPALQMTGLDSLESAAAQCLQLYGGVSLLLAHSTTGRHYPNIFGDESGLGNVYVIPEGAVYTLLYSDAGNGGYALTEAPLDVAGHPELSWETF